MSLRERIRVTVDPAGGRDGGFTIIEVLVAAFILVLASLAIFMTFAAAIHNVQRSRETQIGISVAQREIERVRVIPFDSIRLSSTPAASTDTKSPYNRIRTFGGKPQFAIERGAIISQYQDLMVLEGPAPGSPPAEVAYESPEPLRSNDGTEVMVYRFVTCEDPPDCDAKRVIIDVQPVEKDNLGGYKRAYTELQTTVVNPEAELTP